MFRFSENVFTRSSWEKFCHWERGKDGHGLVQGLLNKVNIDWTDQRKSNIFYTQKRNVSPVDDCRELRIFSCTHCNSWECMSVMMVWLCLQNSKWIIPWWFQDTANIPSMNLCVWSRLSRFIPINLLPFALNITLKYQLFFIFNDILVILIISGQERKLIAKNVGSFIFFSLRVWGI